jgi:hypothetical protein
VERGDLADALTCCGRRGTGASTHGRCDVGATTSQVSEHAEPKILTTATRRSVKSRAGPFAWVCRDDAPRRRAHRPDRSCAAVRPEETRFRGSVAHVVRTVTSSRPDAACSPTHDFLRDTHIRKFDTARPCSTETPLSRNWCTRPDLRWWLRTESCLRRRA